MSIKGVLIETLWNVKEEVANSEKSFKRVLIETLWNVKTSSPCMLPRSPRINRNIVECKVK